MNIALYDTFANPKQCFIIRHGLYIWQLSESPIRTFSAMSIHRVLFNVRGRISDHCPIDCRTVVGAGGLRYEVSEARTFLREGSGPAQSCEVEIFGKFYIADICFSNFFD